MSVSEHSSKAFPRMARRGAAPSCPFEGGGAGIDKVNFPDVRSVLPLRPPGQRKGARSVRSGERCGPGRHHLAPDLDEPVLGPDGAALDVEELRARELADCTIEVLANTFPVDMEDDIRMLDRYDGYGHGFRSGDDCGSSSVSEEDELIAARRLAAQVADELRCQRYFDEKAAHGVGDPVLSSPITTNEHGSPYSAASLSPLAQAPSEYEHTSAPEPWHDYHAAGEREGTAREEEPAPRRRPFDRGIRSGAKGALGALSPSPTGRRVDDDSGGEEYGVDESVSFDAVKNGLYELFCRSADTEDAEKADEAGGEDACSDGAARSLGDEDAGEGRKEEAAVRVTYPAGLREDDAVDASINAFAGISPIVPHRDVGGPGRWLAGIVGVGGGDETTRGVGEGPDGEDDDEVDLFTPRRSLFGEVAGNEGEDAAAPAAAGLADTRQPENEDDGGGYAIAAAVSWTSPRPDATREAHTPPARVSHRRCKTRARTVDDPTSAIALDLSSSVMRLRLDDLALAGSSHLVSSDATRRDDACEDTAETKARTNERSRAQEVEKTNNEEDISNDRVQVGSAAAYDLGGAPPAVAASAGEEVARNDFNAEGSPGVAAERTVRQTTADGSRECETPGGGSRLHLMGPAGEEGILQGRMACKTCGQCLPRTHAGRLVDKPELGDTPRGADTPTSFAGHEEGRFRASPVGAASFSGPGAWSDDGGDGDDERSCVTTWRRGRKQMIRSGSRWRTPRRSSQKQGRQRETRTAFRGVDGQAHSGVHRARARPSPLVLGVEWEGGVHRFSPSPQALRARPNSGPSTFAYLSSPYTPIDDTFAYGATRHAKQPSPGPSHGSSSADGARFLYAGVHSPGSAYRYRLPERSSIGRDVPGGAHRGSGAASRLGDDGSDWAGCYVGCGDESGPAKATAKLVTRLGEQHRSPIPFLDDSAARRHSSRATTPSPGTEGKKGRMLWADGVWEKPLHRVLASFGASPEAPRRAMDVASGHADRWGTGSLGSPLSASQMGADFRGRQLDFSPMSVRVGIHGNDTPLQERVAGEYAFTQELRRILNAVR